VHSTLRVTIDIDDELLIKAANMVGPLDHSAVVKQGLKALIEREAARNLARLDSMQPALKAASRRRSARKP
jgi:Arc/MetJ family transcription regulator